MICWNPSCCETVRIFYVCMGVRICLRITSPDGGIWYTRLFSITPLHSNASSHFDWYQILYQYILNAFEQVEYRSNPARTQFETQAFTRFPVHELRQERSRAPSGAFTNPDGGVHKVHEVHRSRGSPFTRFTVHMERLRAPSGAFTSSVRSIYELRQEPMKHPLD